MKKFIALCVIFFLSTTILSSCTNKKQSSTKNVSNSTVESDMSNKSNHHNGLILSSLRRPVKMKSIPSFVLNSKIYILNEHSKVFKDITPKLISNYSNIFDVYFIDKNTGMVVCAGKDERSFILRTKDGGKTWDKINTGRSAFGAQIYFINKSEGFILLHEDSAMMHENVAVLKTIDGGFTWNVVSEGYDNVAKKGNIPLEGQKNGISFVSDKIGWIAGYSGPAPDKVLLLLTKDSGKTFEDKTTALPSEFKSFEAAADTPIFFSDDLGLMPVKIFSKPVSYIFYTNKDGTEDWKCNFAIKSIKGENLLFSFYGGKNGYATDGTTLYSIKADTGAVSTVKANMNFKDIKKIIFVSKNTGWIITINHIYSSTDGGITWK